MSASFGAALRLLRVDAGLSLRALAERVGVSSAYLSRVENGYDAVPTPDRLVQIAAALDLPPALLIDLASKVGPFVAHYIDQVPAAGALFLEIARRRLGAAQIARLKACLDREFGAAEAAAPAPRLSPLLSPERVVLRLSCGELADALDVAAGRLARGLPGTGAAGIAAALRRREAEAPTALGRGVAVPHAVLPGPALAAVVTLAPPLPAPAADALLRLLVVLLLSGEQGGRAHLACLAHVARLAHAPDFPALADAHEAGDLLARLRAMEDLYG